MKWGCSASPLLLAELSTALPACSTPMPNALPMDPLIDPPEEDLWIFAYGSLMWRPGFVFVEQVPARLIGAHRALCVFSHVHRGTPERPGLVLGLDRGGTCRGIAYRTAAADRTQTLQYLRAREQVTMVYRECMRRVTLLTHPERHARAACYIVDRGHPQYAGRLDLATQLHYVRQGHGKSGTNRDYVLSTVTSLEQLGCRDEELHLLAECLRGAREPHVAVD